MKKKIIILAIVIILLSLGIWSGQNIYEGAADKNVFERTSAQPDGARKAIVQPENTRGESADAFPSNTRGESKKIIAEPSAPAPTVLSFTAIENSTVYDLMQKLKAEGKINFTEKNYTGMGKMITGINGMKSGGERTWIYSVNGEEAQVGVSNYMLKPGDVVSWQYEEVR